MTAAKLLPFKTALLGLSGGECKAALFKLFLDLSAFVRFSESTINKDLQKAKNLKDRKIFYLIFVLLDENI